MTRRPTDAADYDLASGRFSGRDRQDDDSSSRSSDDEQTLGLRGGQTGGARFTAASASLSAVVLLMSVFGSVVYGA